jgi:hypothetical protein
MDSGLNRNCFGFHKSTSLHGQYISNGEVLGCRLNQHTTRNWLSIAWASKAKTSVWINHGKGTCVIPVPTQSPSWHVQSASGGTRPVRSPFEWQTSFIKIIITKYWPFQMTKVKVVRMESFIHACLIIRTSVIRAATSSNPSSRPTSRRRNGLKKNEHAFGSKTKLTSELQRILSLKDVIVAMSNVTGASTMAGKRRSTCLRRTEITYANVVIILSGKVSRNCFGL